MNWTVEWYAIFIKIIKSFVFLTDHNSTTEGPFELTLEDYNTAFQSLQHCTSRKKICDSPRNGQVEPTVDAFLNPS